MAGQFTVVVAVVALVAARLGLGTARPAADFEPPHRLFGGASLRVVNQARAQTHARYRVRCFYKPHLDGSGNRWRSLGAGGVWFESEPNQHIQGR
jgi:hypothetical protein